MLFNVSAPGTRAIISKEKLYQAHGSEGSKHHTHKDKTTNSNAAVSQPSEGQDNFFFLCPIPVSFFNVI